MDALHKFLLLLVLASLGQLGELDLPFTGTAHSVALGSKIIKGKKPRTNSMNYMASLQDVNGEHICGGFLISEDFVMTAAHCDDMDLVSVVLGTHSLENINATMSYGITKCKPSSFKNFRYGSDIMLLKLSRKAHDVKKGQIKPVQLPKKPTNLKSKKKCKVAGWGSTGPGMEFVTELEVAKVPIIDKKTCLKKWNGALPPNVICAGGYKTKKGFCQGDSGGPLVCNKVAVGVVSINNYDNDCDYPNVPNIYTDISKYLLWINYILKKNKC